ncbi:MAG: glycosyltransferase family 4 protein [Butyrivibrio sp.]|nr:glycosyltransferase family 4 protein [Butyrivibrio sp.]
MNIVFLKLYITREINNTFYNSQEIGLAKAVTYIHPEHRVDIILLSKACVQEEAYGISDRITVHVFPAKGIGHHGILDLSILLKMKADLVHLLADNMLYAPSVIRYCKKNSIMCHLYIGTLYTDSNNWIKKVANKALIGRNIKAYRAVPVYVKTPAVQNQCKKHGIDAKLAPVGIGVEDTTLSVQSVQEIRDEYGIPMEKKVMLFVGRLESYKHPYDALELLEKLDDSHYLLIVGKGALESDFEQMIFDKKLTGRVTLLQTVPNVKMRNLYKACDYYVNFNPDEIYGMAILEAMCHRCPVIAINAPGPEFMINNGENGYICESWESMYDIITMLDNDKELAATIADSARTRILSDFVWDKVAGCFEDFE